MEDLLVTICARGGSKGIPGKNIKEVAGKPLLAYTAEIAKDFARRHKADIAFSTDSDEILAVGEKLGLPADYVRPPELGNDTVGKPVVIKHLTEFYENKYGKEYRYIIDLDVTSPIRKLDDIEGCLNLMKANPEALTVFSVSPCHRNPYFNMVELKDNGFYGLVCRHDTTTRQHAPKVFDINGSIYVYARASLTGENPRAVTDRTLVYVMNHICFDLDEPEDYDYLSFLLSTRKLSI